MDLSEQFTGTGADKVRAELARVTAPAPVSASSDLFVIVNSFDGGRAEHGPCLWEPPAGALPAVGELCVVVRAVEEDGEGEQTIVIAFDRNDSAALKVPLVTALPGSPIDGQEIYYQNADLAAQGILWHFRYNAGSASPYKWEAVGKQQGSQKLQTAAAVQTTANVTTYAAMTNGPSHTAPLSGEWMQRGEGALQAQAAGVEGRVARRVNGVAGGIYGWIVAAAAFEANICSFEFSTNLAAGDVITLGVATNNLGLATGSVALWKLWMQPVRVG